MKLLLVHERYQQPGGEETVFAEESALLRRHGHQVVEYTEDNRRIGQIGRAATAARAIWSSGTKLRLRELLRRERPAVAHFHNTFPLISPSAYWACREAGTPVVQTLHNYRLLCAAALFFRSGQPCEDCLGRRLLWPGVLHGCYRGSRWETAGVTAMLQSHRLLRTWETRVALFVALTEFARSKFVQGGIPDGRLTVKPNFVHPDPGAGDSQGEYALFAGRLSEEKGIRLLLDAWQMLPEVPLVICGDGPMRDLVDAFARSRSRGDVRVFGSVPRRELFDMMKGARFLVFPSLYYECFPMAIAEAFACGLPVLAASHGAAAEIIEHGRTGVLFDAKDPRGLAEAAGRLWARPAEARVMGREARAEFLLKYTAERNYGLLMEAYARARDAGRDGAGSGSV
jgi:glycosyltransferase involved in cell wall biosynthesis